MPHPVFIGDEVSAAGYRLAGARVHAVAPEQAGETLTRAMTEAELVIITRAYMERVPATQRERALRGLRPLVVVVSDAAGAAPLADLGAWTRAQLGVET